MIVLDIIDEDFVNYKKSSMTILMPYCSFKCNSSYNKEICQNYQLKFSDKINISSKALIERYLINPISESIVFQGLEPFDSWDDLYEFISLIRITYKCDDDIVIYTGYNIEEIQSKIDQLRGFHNIIIKFGRYIPDQEKHFDNVLGVYLASDNQYTERIS